jgi:hypothetical protein
MPSPSKSRRKKGLDPISYDELLDSPSMTGLVSFLDIRPNEAAGARPSTTNEVGTDMPTEGLTPTAGPTPPVVKTSIEISCHNKNDLTTPTAGLTPPVGVKTSVGASPSGGETIAEGVTPTVVLMDSLQVGGHAQKLEDGPPSVGASTPEAAKPTVGLPSRPLTYSPVDKDLTDSLDLAVSVGGSPTVPVLGATLASDIDKPPRREMPPETPRATLPRLKDPLTVGVSPPATSGIWVSLVTGGHYEAKRVQRVVLAQQSMSLGEERVYQTLWHAKPADGVTQLNRRTKLFSIGYDRLARLTRLNEKSIRDLIPKLIDKKILEIVMREDSWTRTGRTYHIYSYEEILDRQRAVDLCYIVKNGRAVEFVRPAGQVWEGVSPAATVGERPPVRVSPAVIVTRTETVGVPDAKSVGDSPTPLDKTRQNSSREILSSSDIERLAQSIRAILPSFDDDALRQLWQRCHQTAPDCTVDDVVYCFNIKAHQLLRRPQRITNPVGLMIWSVPKALEGTNGLHLRRRQELEEASERERRLLEQQRAEWRQMLADPRTPEEDRKFLCQLLDQD